MFAGFPFLSVLILLPLVGAGVVAVLPKARPGLAKTVTLVWSLAVFGLAAAMYAAFQVNGPRFQFHESYPWIRAWGARFTLEADGIALVMIALVALLVPLVILASWHDVEDRSLTGPAQVPARDDRPAGPAQVPAREGKRSVPAYFSLLLALEFTMIGV